VLSVPYELRLLLAREPHVLTAVGRIFVQEIFRWQRERAGPAIPEVTPFGLLSAAVVVKFMSPAERAHRFGLPILLVEGCTHTGLPHRPRGTAARIVKPSEPFAGTDALCY